MKKVIFTFIVILMTVFMSTAAKAEISITMPTKAEVSRIVIEAIPVAGPKEIDNCYDAMKQDGFYRIYSSKVTIVCSKNELTRVWAQ